MDDKKQLIETTYDMEHSEALLETGQKIKAKSSSVEKQTNAGAITLPKIVILICLSLFMAFLVLITVRIVITVNTNNYIKFQTSFQGKEGQLIDQEVITSGVDNIIKYKVQLSPTKQLNIIDDFNRDLQIVRISTPVYQICYVSQLGKDSYVHPEDLIFGSKNEDKGYVSRVYETGDKPLDDLTLLGLKGQELCQDAPVYWIEVVEGTDISISSTNFTAAISSSSALESDKRRGEGDDRSVARSRTRRNIRQCSTSCCWLVCCCDVEHFTWEREEHFTCNHVCHKCTPHFKSIIRKLC